MQATLPTLNAAPSLWTRSDPRWKLAGVLGMLTAIAVCRTLPIALMFLALGVGACLWARLPARAWLDRLSGLVFFLVLVLLIVPLSVPGAGWGPFSGRGFEVALLLAVKMLAALAWSALLVGTSPVAELITAARACGLPAYAAHLALLTQRYLFLLNEQLNQLRIALRLRGFRNRPNRRSYRTIGQVAGTLLVRSHDRAERIGQALACRGYAGSLRLLRRFATRWGDVLLFMALVGLALGLGIVDFLAHAS
jgi:cobalt/nickel transport system permease protein